jgi:hypothetical protein
LAAGEKAIGERQAPADLSQGENDRWGFKGFVSHNGIVSPRWWAHETSAPSKVSSGGTRDTRYCPLMPQPFWEFGPVSYDANSS